VEKQSERSDIKKGTAELATLKGDASKIREKNSPAKEKNAAKMQDLFKTQNDYPA
jgi:hypothetical protein